MSDFQHKPGMGSIKRNRFKEEGSNQPDLKGDGMSLEGEPVEFAAWAKKDKNGEPYFSLKFGPPRQKDRVPDGTGAKIQNVDHGKFSTQTKTDQPLDDEIGRRASKAPMDDEIPFAPEWR